MSGAAHCEHSRQVRKIGGVKEWPEALDGAAVVQALFTGWQIETTDIRFVPLGEGCYHWSVDDTDQRRWFVSATDLDDAPWLGADRASAWRRLKTTMQAAADLRTTVGHSFVVAPTPCPDGCVAWRVNERYGLVIHDFLEGECGDFGAPLDESTSATVLDMVAALHATPTASVELGGLVEIAPRDALDLDDPAFGPILDRYDELRRSCDGQQQVVTHGEPHAGNIMRVDGDTYLIDWDTVALALPERDLWLLVDHGIADVLTGYEERTGHLPNPEALSLYRLQWTIEDLMGSIRDGDDAASQRLLEQASIAAGL